MTNTLLHRLLNLLFNTHTHLEQYNTIHHIVTPLVQYLGEVPSLCLILHPTYSQHKKCNAGAFISDHENSNWVLHPTKLALQPCYSSKLYLCLEEYRALPSDVALLSTKEHEIIIHPLTNQSFVYTILHRMHKNTQ